jgi:ribose 5-phosphate isomerase A
MDVEVAKRAVGAAAAELVRPGMRLGLGSGSTAKWFILALADRVRAGLDVVGVASSDASAALAREHGIPLVNLDSAGLDLAVDGADAVDRDLRLIKGRGGAHVREKIVAAAARQFVVVVDASKLCDQLSGRLPVELLHFGAEHTLQALAATGGHFEWRRDAAGEPMLSDNGNPIADGDYGVIEDAEGLAERLDAVPGMVGHGLFLGMTDLVLVAHLDGRLEEITPAE